MWYADAVYDDTNYVAIVSKTDNSAEIFRGVLSSETTQFSVSHAWGDPPSNPITSITRSIAASLTSAAQSADSIKSSVPQLVGSAIDQAKNLGFIKEGSDLGEKINRITSKIVGMTINEGQVVIPAGEYFKTYNGTSYEVPSCSVTTILIADQSGKLTPSNITTPGSHGVKLDAIVENFVPPDSKQSAGGLFIQMSAPGGYQVPSSIQENVKGSFQIVWGNSRNPKYLKNLLPANISIVRSNSLVRDPTTNQTSPLYFILTVDFIPAKAYIKDQFKKAVRGE